MEALKFASFNVNGINSPNKRRVIFDKIRNSHAHIALIQETHSSEATAQLWAAEWGGKALFNHGLPGSRGVAILFRRNFLPKITSQKRDEHERILAIDLEVEEEIYTVATLYAPSDNVVLGGDFNCILDPQLDRNSTADLPNSTSAHRNRIRTLMEERTMCDIMRVRNPDKRIYTFR